MLMPVPWVVAEVLEGYVSIRVFLLRSMGPKSQDSLSIPEHQSWEKTHT